MRKTKTQNSLHSLILKDFVIHHLDSTIYVPVVLFLSVSDSQSEYFLVGINKTRFYQDEAQTKARFPRES